MERCLDADDQINALYYRLLDWIQPHFARGLAVRDDGADEVSQVELLTREDLAQLKAETALPVPLDYEQFRHHMSVALRDHLLEGINLPETLRLISEDVTRRHGLRPVLLVDDLLATGGTMKACCDLVRALGGSIVGVAVLIELTFLGGRDKLADDDVLSVIEFDSE